MKAGNLSSTSTGSDFSAFAARAWPLRWIGLWLVLWVGAGQIRAQTANYEKISAYRFVSVRQTSPNGPTIRDYYLFLSVGFNQSNSVTSLNLQTPTGKKYGFRRWQNSSPWGGNANTWEQYFGINANQARHMSLMPGGTYQLQCGGGNLAGQTISFQVPANLVNPCVPFLERSSFLLLNSRKLDVTKENTLLVRRTLRTGAPFVVTPQPDGAIRSLFVQIRDDSATGDAVFVWYASVQYDDAGNGSFTIPAGKLLKNKIYALSLQTDNDYPDASVPTPEGNITSRSDGITYYELIFRTAK